MSARLLPFVGTRPERDSLARAAVRKIERDVRLRIWRWRLRVFVVGHPQLCLLVLAAVAVAIVTFGGGR